MPRTDTHLDGVLRHLGAAYYDSLQGRASQADVTRAVDSVAEHLNEQAQPPADDAAATRQVRHVLDPTTGTHGDLIPVAIRLMWASTAWSMSSTGSASPSPSLTEMSLRPSRQASGANVPLLSGHTPLCLAAAIGMG